MDFWGENLLGNHSHTELILCFIDGRGSDPQTMTVNILYINVDTLRHQTLEGTLIITKTEASVYALCVLLHSAQRAIFNLKILFFFWPKNNFAETQQQQQGIN